MKGICVALLLAVGWPMTGAAQDRLPPIPPDKIPPFVAEANRLLQDSDSTQLQIQALRVLNSIE